MQINSYNFGSIVIDNKKYEHDVIVSAGKVRAWQRRTSHEVTVADLAPILEENPKLIIFGTGASGVMEVLAESTEYLSKQAIGFKILPTPEATREFNKQAAAAGVVGAFHLTC